MRSYKIWYQRWLETETLNVAFAFSSPAYQSCPSALRIGNLKPCKCRRYCLCHHQNLQLSFVRSPNIQNQPCSFQILLSSKHRHKNLLGHLLMRNTLNLHISPQRQLSNRHTGPNWLWILAENLGVDFVHGGEVFHVCEENIDCEIYS
jgi:hypothetical protein